MSHQKTSRKVLRKKLLALGLREDFDAMEAIHVLRKSLGAALELTEGTFLYMCNFCISP